MTPLWHAVRHRLEQYGTDNRGRVTVPPLTAPGRQSLAGLLGRTPTKLVDLATLEGALVDLGVGIDLAEALDQLGFPVSPEPAQRRAARAESHAARTSARATAETWPEPWAPEWIESVIRSGVLKGLTPDDALELIASSRRVLDHIDETHRDESSQVSRATLAASVLGDAHALDPGRSLETMISRALAFRLDADPRDDARRLWEASGVASNLTSGPVLVWNLPVAASSGLGSLMAAATSAGIPLHLSRMALQQHPIEVLPDRDILVVENPAILEAAVQQRVDRGVVCANGSPSLAVRLLIEQLQTAGARLHYHGDFDTPGLMLCARMEDLGVVPWRMDLSDYAAALHAADSAGVDLPRELEAPPPTPWDPALQLRFDQERRIVHEERLLPDLLEGI